MVKLEELDILTSEEACEILDISGRSNLLKLIKSYEIPHKKLSIGNIFLRKDIIDFQNSPERQENLKHRRKSTKKKR